MNEDDLIFLLLVFAGLFGIWWFKFREGEEDKLAAQSGSRRGYEMAVADWEADGAWVSVEMKEETDNLGRYGFV